MVRDYNVITRSESVKTELIRIGNSRGVRIPKPLIEQCGLGDTVELRVDNQRLIISPERRARAGWEKAFRAAASSGEDEILLQDAEPTEFERQDWRW